MEIYILRHGETEYNRRGLVQGSGIDSDLNELGHQQAAAFYKRYKDSGFELVITSALKRTHQTVQGFIEAGTLWIQQADINEISWGEHEGQPGTPERIARYQAVVANWECGQYDAALPQGESARQLEARLHRFLHWLRQRPERKILICTHGRTMRALITMLKGLPLSEMETVAHRNTGCFVVHFRERDIHFEKENDISHLVADE